MATSPADAAAGLMTDNQSSLYREVHCLRWLREPHGRFEWPSMDTSWDAAAGLMTDNQSSLYREVHCLRWLRKPHGRLHWVLVDAMLGSRSWTALGL